MIKYLTYNTINGADWLYAYAYWRQSFIGGYPRHWNARSSHGVYKRIISNYPVVTIKPRTIGYSISVYTSVSIREVLNYSPGIIVTYGYDQPSLSISNVTLLPRTILYTYLSMSFIAVKPLHQKQYSLPTHHVSSVPHNCIALSVCTWPLPRPGTSMKNIESYSNEGDCPLFISTD